MFLGELRRALRGICVASSRSAWREYINDMQNHVRIRRADKRSGARRAKTFVVELLAVAMWTHKAIGYAACSTRSVRDILGMQRGEPT